jgi:hypothetical protein
VRRERSGTPRAEEERDMRSYGRNPIVRLVVVGMALWQWGCAVTRPIAAAIPPSPEIRAQLGVVRVVSASEAPKTDLIGPTRGRGALRGALATAGPGAKVGLAPGVAVMYVSMPLFVIPPLGALVFAGGVALTAAGAIAGAGLGALGGAIHGAATTEPISKEGAAALRNALEDSTLQEALRRRAEDVARERTRLTFARVSTEPALPDVEPDPGDAPITPDTILEVALQSLELKRTGEEIDAGVALVAVARGRLRRADGSAIDECVATSTSLARSAAEWTADDASQFRADLAVAADSLARQIVEALLVQGSSEELASPESSDVTEGQP